MRAGYPSRSRPCLRQTRIPPPRHGHRWPRRRRAHRRGATCGARRRCYRSEERGRPSDRTRRRLFPGRRERAASCRLPTTAPARSTTAATRLSIRAASCRRRSCSAGWRATPIARRRPSSPRSRRRAARRAGWPSATSTWCGCRARGTGRCGWSTARRRAFRLATLEGHLEAGQIEFAAPSSAKACLCSAIESWARSGDRLSDLLYDRLRFSKEVQFHMWTSFLERVVELSGGKREGGLRIHTAARSRSRSLGRPAHARAAARAARRSLELRPADARSTRRRQAGLEGRRLLPTAAAGGAGVAAAGREASSGPGGSWRTTSSPTRGSCEPLYAPRFGVGGTGHAAGGSLLGPALPVRRARRRRRRRAPGARWATR